ncbi:Aldedh-domain-containing protein [Rhizodiscina lignyota]|uniref:Aldedh-domain-containing protein n=1 Tax=Rhizodiscina lignyota TaxID=1504668 RepID=A0A9P4I5I4_9PEZI|nr:Aldedh-domain-containing protein [Rhizodiscina lignyota]
MRAPPIPPNQLSAQQLALHNDMKSVIASDLHGFQTETDQGALTGPWSVWLQDPSTCGAIWNFVKVITTQAKLPQSVRQVAILKVGSHFKAAYELYAHTGLSKELGINKAQIDTLAKGARPASVQGKEAAAYDVTDSLTRGGVVPDAIYNNAVKLLGEDGYRELVYLVGSYLLVSVTLNGFDVKAPVEKSAPAPSKPAHVSEYQTLNPVTEKLEQVFPETTDEEVMSLLERAHHVYENDWKLRPVKERAAIVGRAGAILRQKAEEYSQLMTHEMGKLIDQSRYEVNLTVDILDYYATHGEKFLETKEVPEAPGAILATEPIGAILAVEPWNFPYYQLVRVAAPQIVAGNVLMCKHAPSTPQCALAFEKLFDEAGAPKGVYTNLFSTIPQINMLIDDFRIRGVTLTGSERAGASVAERAGRNLKKVVLELGGSDPLIVLPDADLESTINQGVMGRMICMGQACVSSKRFIVVGKDRAKIFLDGMIKRMAALEAGDPSDSKTTLGPLFAKRALVGLLEQVERAEAHGAKVVLGGKRINRPGWYMEPTIITDIKPDNPLYQEETFGPIASFYAVDTEEEAIKLANATKFGLGGSVFGGNVKHAQEVASKVDSGMVFVNSCANTGPEVPFGGIKNSGFGRELSELGIGEFVNRKLIQTTL